MRLWLALLAAAAIGLGAVFAVGAGIDRVEPTEDLSIAAAMQAPAEPRTQARSLHVKARGQLGPGKGTLLIALEPPAGGKLSVGSPVSVRARGEHLAFPERTRAPLDPKALPLKLPVDVTDGALGPAKVELSFYWCDESEQGSCHPERVELVVDLDLSGDAEGGEAFVAYRVSRS